MSWIVIGVYTQGGAWLESEHQTEEQALLEAEKGNVEAERFGLPWILKAKKKAS